METGVFHETDIEGKIFLNKYFKFAKNSHLAKMDIIIGYFDPGLRITETSDFKGDIHCMGSKGWKRYCIKLDLLVSDARIRGEPLWMDDQVWKIIAPGVGLLIYMEKQFSVDLWKSALWAKKNISIHW